MFGQKSLHIVGLAWMVGHRIDMFGGYTTMSIASGFELVMEDLYTLKTTLTSPSTLPILFETGLFLQRPFGKSRSVLAFRRNGIDNMHASTSPFLQRPHSIPRFHIRMQPD
jgi:hypothetical protein